MNNRSDRPISRQACSPFPLGPSGRTCKAEKKRKIKTQPLVAARLGVRGEPLKTTGRFAHALLEDSFRGDSLAGRSQRACLCCGRAARPGTGSGQNVKIGITLPLTGADAEDATLIRDGAMMAIDEANAKGG